MQASKSTTNTKLHHIQNYDQIEYIIHIYGTVVLVVAAVAVTVIDIVVHCYYINRCSQWKGNGKCL